MNAISAEVEALQELVPELSEKIGGVDLNAA